MADQDSQNGVNTYELRREARGTEPGRQRHPWRLIITAAVLGLALILAGAGAFVGWYYFVNVQTQSARVRADSVKLAAKVDARLLELSVHERDSVHQGQVVARLDDTELRAELAAAEAEKAIRESACAAALAREQLVKAQVDAGVAKAAAQVKVAEAEVAARAAELAAATTRRPDQVRRARAQYASKQAALKQLRHGPRQEEVEAARARLASARASLALYELEEKQSRQLVDEGIDSQHLLEVRRTQVETQRSAVREAELVLQTLLAGPTADEIEAMEKAVEAEAAALALAESASVELDVMRCQLEIRKASLAEARAALATAEADRYQCAAARQGVVAAEAELRKANARVDGCHAALDSMEIISPIDGTVTRTFDEVGEICRKGIPSMIVAADDQPRWIEGFVHERDAMLVAVGQRASVRVPAGSPTRIGATVAAVGLHTQSLDQAGASTGPPAFGQPDQVWVKLKPDEPLPRELVTGTTAQAAIRVR